MQDTDGPVWAALERVAHEAGLTNTLKRRLVEITQGMAYRDIAALHGISINTVRTQARALLQSLGVRSRHEILHAVRAAHLRAEAGATVEELYGFLLLRFE